MLILVLEANRWRFFAILPFVTLDSANAKRLAGIALEKSDRAGRVLHKIGRAQTSGRAFRLSNGKTAEPTQFRAAHGNEKIQNAPRRIGLIVRKTSRFPTIANVLIAAGKRQTSTGRTKIPAK